MPPYTVCSDERCAERRHLACLKGLLALSAQSTRHRWAKGPALVLLQRGTQEVTWPLIGADETRHTRCIRTAFSCNPPCQVREPISSNFARSLLEFVIRARLHECAYSAKAPGRGNGPTRIRTWNQGIRVSRGFPPGADYLFTLHLRWAQTSGVRDARACDQGRSSPQVVSAPSGGVPPAWLRVATVHAMRAAEVSLSSSRSRPHIPARRHLSMSPLL